MRDEGQLRDAGCRNLHLHINNKHVWGDTQTDIICLNIQCDYGLDNFLTEYDEKRCIINGP